MKDVKVATGDRLHLRFRASVQDGEVPLAKYGFLVEQKCWKARCVLMEQRILDRLLIGQRNYARDQ